MQLRGEVTEVRADAVKDVDEMNLLWAEVNKKEYRG
jgi:hypothetical protein